MKCHPIEFKDGNFVWPVLTKECILLVTRKIYSRKNGPVEIIEKINSNAYCLKHHSHMQTANIFNVKHLILFFMNNSFEEDATQISWAKFMSHGVDEIEHLTLYYLRCIESGKKLSRKVSK